MIIKVTDPNNTSIRVNLTHNILKIRIPELKLDLYQKIESIRVNKYLKNKESFKRIIFLLKRNSVQGSSGLMRAVSSLFSKTKVRLYIFNFFKKNNT
jgi:hypothetical protein